MNFVQPSLLAQSFEVVLGILDVIEGNSVYVSRNPKCEPQLGKRGLYRAIGGMQSPLNELAMLWVLNLADGEHSLLDIAERSDCPFREIRQAASLLSAHELLRRSDA
jgi:aminopeptidase-like protein